jgi:hypothetical protein
MDGTPAMQEIHVSLRSFDADYATPLNECVVGRAIWRIPEFEFERSFVLRVQARMSDGSIDLLHRACSYRIGNFAVLADAWSSVSARCAGFHLPGLAKRVAYNVEEDRLPPENILVLPQLGADWTHKMQPFGFEIATCAVKKSLPSAIYDLKQMVFNLSGEGLKQMLEGARQPLQLQMKRFQHVPVVDSVRIASCKPFPKGPAQIFHLNFPA